MKNGLIIPLLFILLFIYACNQASAPQEQRTPGNLSIVYLQGFEKRTPVQPEILQNGDVSFNLGSIKASRDFYFLLQNQGSYPITGITLQTDNSDFSVQPASIDRLESGSQTSVIPIIRGSAHHGLALEGIGLIDLMPMGSNTTLLSIHGQTQDESANPLDVDLTADLQVNALVMDIDIMDGQSPLDLYHPPWRMYGGPWANYVDNHRFYQIQNPDNIQISNTGNIDIELMIHQYYSGTVVLQQTVTAGNAIQLSIPLDYGSDPAHRTVMIIIDSGNTISERAKFETADDGKVYFAIGDNI